MTDQLQGRGVLAGEICGGGSRVDRRTAVMPFRPASQWPQSSYEVLLPRSGAFFLCRGARRVLVDVNHALLDAGGSSYRLEAGPVGFCSTILAVPRDALEPAVNGKSAERGEALEPIVRGSICVVEPIVALLHRQLIYLLTRRDHPDPLEIEERVVDLVARLRAAAWHQEAGERPVRQRTAAAHLEAVERVKLLLHKQYRKKISLSEVARTVATSPYHLSRLFKRETGLPIYRYVLNLRLRGALEEICAGHAEDLSRLALDLGFASHSHFTDAFTQTFGMPPSRVRAGRENSLMHSARTLRRRPRETTDRIRESRT